MLVASFADGARELVTASRPTTPITMPRTTATAPVRIPDFAITLLLKCVGERYHGVGNPNSDALARLNTSRAATSAALSSQRRPRSGGATGTTSGLAYR